MEIEIHFPANKKLYIKNPETSELGQKIIAKSIENLNLLGLEGFNFKRLATDIQSNEASIYRYFENKHNLLAYLISIYWQILEVKIQFSTQNLLDPADKLKQLIFVLTDVEKAAPVIKNIDLNSLHNIVISESAKVYLTKKVEVEIKEGYFIAYEKLIYTIADIFKEINPGYEFPKALAINLVETTYEQFYFSQHLGSLTELEGKEMSSNTVRRFLETLIFPTLDIKL